MAETAVVVGTDGSPIGDALVRRGLVLAKASGSRLHVVAPESVLAGAMRIVVVRDVDFEAHEAHGQLNAAVWEVAERVDADLIVVDRAVRNPLHRALRWLHRRLAPNAWIPVELIDRRALPTGFAPGTSRIAAS
jgi:nucleotide-binding universal stress UspA family protein